MRSAVVNTGLEVSKHPSIYLARGPKERSEAKGPEERPEAQRRGHPGHPS